MQTIYRPGQWYLLVMPGALVALPPDVPGDIISGLWDRLPPAKTLATVVDVLTSHAGGSFTALPPFAAAVAEGSDLRIALRGRVVARVSNASDEIELTGAEVTTWSERFIAGARRVEITVEDAGSGSVLPVHTGLVLAAAVSADLEPADAEQLSGALGPVPVVVSASMGVSAAALAGAPAPLLAHFPVPGIVAPREPSPAASAAAGTPDAAGSGALAGSAVPADADEAEPTPAETGSSPEADATADAAEIVEAPEPAGDSSDPVIEDVPDGADVEDAPEAEEDEAEETENGEADPFAELGLTPVEPPADAATLLPNEVTLAPTPDDDFDQLWGATVHSVSSISDRPGALASEPEGTGDHDGATISAAELRALRQQPPAVADDVATAVLPVAGVPAGSGRIRVSTGQVVALDRTVIIGRRPRSTRASGDSLPHLIAVESPQQDISRSHLEIRPEGDTVVVIDLHTTNGSTLLRPGADPMRLHPGEQTLVLSGDVVDLGDGVTVAFEELP
ncbi:FHA domain-containing protein [Microbacterium sp.]|uniref:FHA domain-containing protein n=1 Tax=Microbacterium sp. TaxID=51671 RepID=UPI0028123EC4|nr:FHA domain-containing protein [Microbacterium sp.]